MYRADRGYALTANPLRREFTRHFESTLVILASTAGFVLLIVCASVANLAVARTMRRDRELVLRTALGASRGRLLAATRHRKPAARDRRRRAAGCCSPMAAWIFSSSMPADSRRGPPRSASTWRCCSSRSAVSILTGIIAAVLPAVSRRIGTRRARNGAGPRTPSRRSDLRRALIVAEVAASFMLLIGAGLMVRSLVETHGCRSGLPHRSRIDDAD